jgi:predicted cupin superfamily sugar epimerase
MSRLSKAEVIASLGLGGHFEGGYFRETFRPTHREKLATTRGPRGTMTSI